MRQRAVATRSGARARDRAPARSFARRRTGRRGRRRLLWLAGIVAVAVIGWVVLRPIVDKAIIELTLPLQHEDIIPQPARAKDLDPRLDRAGN